MPIYGSSDLWTACRDCCKRWRHKAMQCKYAMVTLPTKIWPCYTHKRFSDSLFFFLLAMVLSVFQFTVSDCVVCLSIYGLWLCFLSYNIRFLITLFSIFKLFLSPIQEIYLTIIKWFPDIIWVINLQITKTDRIRVVAELRVECVFFPLIII